MIRDSVLRIWSKIEYIPMRTPTIHRTVTIVIVFVINSTTHTTITIMKKFFCRYFITVLNNEAVRRWKSSLSFNRVLLFVTVPPFGDSHHSSDVLTHCNPLTKYVFWEVSGPVPRHLKGCSNLDNIVSRAWQKLVCAAQSPDSGLQDVSPQRYLTSWPWH